MKASEKEMSSASIYGVLLVSLFVQLCMGSQLRAESRDDFNLKDANHFELQLPEIKSLEEWTHRRVELRTKLLLSAGLWPELEKTPLNPRVFDEKQGRGFRVSKVHFESLPGFMATGNLYRPAGGSGPFPAVFTPHGHWGFGRLQNGESGSIPGRCIDLARQGFVVLSLDMVGYNDSFQLPHDANKSRAQLKADVPLPYEPRVFRAEFNFQRAQLYGFSLGGLQLWNSIRAIDFLCSLPEVDDERIGVTGASGGATQTILVMVADERVRVAAPVNIIGADKHPGCGCENIPGLWVDASTVEMSAVFAPRPLLLMSASEDPWTHSTPTREFPMFKKYYALYGASDKVSNVHIQAGHNYNAETRAAVYKWFCQHLQSPIPPIQNPEPISQEVKELGDLRVFPDKILPETAISGWQVMRNWIKTSEEAYQKLLPLSSTDWPAFAEKMRGALRLLLAVKIPSQDDLTSRVKVWDNGGKDKLFRINEVSVPHRHGWLELESLESDGAAKGNMLLVFPEELGSLAKLEHKRYEEVVGSLVARNLRVARVRGFASRQFQIPLSVWDSYSWSDAYNRSNPLRSVQDIVTALAYLKKVYPAEPVSVIGLGACGIEAAFGAAVFGNVQRVVLDFDKSDPGYDGELLNRMPVGSLKRVGDFRTAMLLLMQNRIYAFNAGPSFNGELFVEQAARMGLEHNLNLRPGETQLDLAAVF